MDPPIAGSRLFAFFAREWGSTAFKPLVSTWSDLVPTILESASKLKSEATDRSVRPTPAPCRDFCFTPPGFSYFPCFLPTACAVGCILPPLRG
jgi:hypothetical protein